ncbi:prenylcysteine oxidase-like isoform X2 [Gigantopelta aegis]|nr:prenylcysteine oxidase-like isoform X2 [Gigantopelta aegis]
MLMLNFTKMLGLERRDCFDGKLGLYGSDGVVFETSSWSAVTLAKLAWRYGWDMWKIRGWINDQVINKFERIYEIQDKGIAFTTVEDILKVMDPMFVDFTKKSVKTLLKEEGFGDKFIDEFVMAALQTSYGQTTDVAGFVGAVSIAGITPGLWSVKGGNKRVPEKLIKKSKANLIMPAKVTNIILQKDTDGIVSYEVQYTNPDKQPSAREYDIVIIATPLPQGQTNIKFEDFPQPVREPKMSLHKLALLFVQGTPNITTFGYEHIGDLPQALLSMDPNLFWNSYAQATPVDYKKHLNKKSPDGMEELVYKVALNQVPTEPQIRLLFKSRKDLRVVHWGAYPDFSPDMELPSFLLYDRLYYVNAIESAASAMEMNAIGGRNIALLAYNHWHGYLDKIDELHDEDTTSSSKNEEL